MGVHFRKHGNCYHLRIGKNKYDKNNDWLTFYWTKGFEITYNVAGYFDNRPHLHITLFLFTIKIVFPFYNKWTDECDPPKYGIAYHHQTLWIYRGGKGNMNGGNKWWAIRMPWSYEWVRTSCLCKDGTWEHETKGNRKDFWDKEKWEDVLWKETYPYTYILKNGVVQKRFANVRVEEREWRMRWLKWTSLFSKNSTTIDVEFNDEVGERTGSWKGGTIGCSYEMKYGELPEQTLRRMERERKFN